MTYYRYRNYDGFVFVNIVERTNHKRCLTMGLLTGKYTGDYIIIDWAYTVKYVNSFVVFRFLLWHLSILGIRDGVHKLIIHSKFAHLHMPWYEKHRCRWHMWQWRHNGLDGVSNHQSYHCLFNSLFKCRLKQHQSSVSLAFVEGIHRWHVNSWHKWPVTRRMVLFDDVIKAWQAAVYITWALTCK